MGLYNQRLIKLKNIKYGFNKLFKGIKRGRINRADVADFLIKQAEKQTELKKYIAISEK